MQLGAKRHQPLHGLQLRLDTAAHLDDVAAGNTADAYGQCWLAVVADDLPWPLGIVAFQRGNRAQIHTLLALADRQGAQSIQRVESARRADVYKEFASTHASRFNGGIGIGQCREQLLRGQAQRSQARLVDLHQNPLLTHASEFDLTDAVGRDQPATQILAHFMQLFQRQAIAGKGEEDAIDIAKVIIDQRRIQARRQLLSGVLDLAA